MYDLKKVHTISSANVSTLPLARPVKRAKKRRSQPAIDLRNPRLVMGLIFLFLLLAYLIAYAQEGNTSPRPYLVIEPTAGQIVAPGSMLSQPLDEQPRLEEQPQPIPLTGR